MKTHWLKKEDNDTVVIFFAGWGQSPSFFSAFEAENKDVIMVYHYSNLVFDILMNEVENYKNKVIIAWSFGVHVAGLFTEVTSVDKLICLNGSFTPIHDTEGIPNAIYQGTYDQLTENNWKKFVFRICGSKELSDHFLKVSDRAIEDLKEELYFLGQLPQIKNTPKVNLSIIGNKDRIFPPKNLENHWANRSEHLIVDTIPHFGFSKYTNWDSLINCKAEVTW
ncbi:pimeloyl-ACP methyl esterase BioG family protein [Flammeovirga kamogawensis]|uniref:DUF452 family protein n=1 Tax=Flammeovirga kamogawensis TaxID=373891 RepID=A0ABX8GW75_9BACT|nr:pimeloyl-ACP methyl esterase BioG family protein [Flammeovirga kamogawensis]MBB6461010.1 biotin synthesis protein BioG [Flammeovirga kamogawensis]QWG07581.1 DUF452 family protein [Flammeovirga kamogawensis]TRX69393.1 DUF452 family protein [Flammeovirga kamogawensis]